MTRNSKTVITKASGFVALTSISLMMILARSATVLDSVVSLERDASLSEHHLCATATFLYDPEALVAVSVGADGQPGQAGVDDTADDVIDDASELGAFGSDDQCSVFRGDRRDVPSDSPILVLQKGSFRFIDQADDTVFPQVPEGTMVEWAQRWLANPSGRERNRKRWGCPFCC